LVESLISSGIEDHTFVAVAIMGRGTKKVENH